MLIATRTLYVRTGAGAEEGFEVRVFKPEQDGSAWRCRYEIDWPRGMRKSFGQGVDGAQAIIIALQKVGAELYTSNYHAKDLLRFEKPGDGYGFPVPKPMRDMLVGGDAVFEGN
ncbi:hypothetical protein [Devosia sp. XK-2]|uniref:DUF6968 family protein n=1 Tax=Devosia sp. XK-2 TaxID=3126689 RepID=UPI0030CCD38E